MIRRLRAVPRIGARVHLWLGEAGVCRDARALPCASALGSRRWFVGGGKHALHAADDRVPVGVGSLVHRDEVAEEQDAGDPAECEQAGGQRVSGRRRGVEEAGRLVGHGPVQDEFGRVRVGRWLDFQDAKSHGSVRRRLAARAAFLFDGREYNSGV